MKADETFTSAEHNHGPVQSNIFSPADTWGEITGRQREQRRALSSLNECEVCTRRNRRRPRRRASRGFGDAGSKVQSCLFCKAFFILCVSTLKSLSQMDYSLVQTTRCLSRFLTFTDKHLLFRSLGPNSHNVESAVNPQTQANQNRPLKLTVCLHHSQYNQSSWCSNTR